MLQQSNIYCRKTVTIPTAPEIYNNCSKPANFAKVKMVKMITRQGFVNDLIIKCRQKLRLSWTCAVDSCNNRI